MPGTVLGAEDSVLNKMNMHGTQDSREFVHMNKVSQAKEVQHITNEAIQETVLCFPRGLSHKALIMNL